jgi:hypothetical protein
MSQALLLKTTRLALALGFLDIDNNALLSTVNFPVLTQVSDFLRLRRCPRLSQIIAPSLKILQSFLTISDNAALTYLHLPVLTYIAGRINICQNNPAFKVPTGPPDAPVERFYSGASPSIVCTLADGNATCIAPDASCSPPPQ